MRRSASARLHTAGRRMKPNVENRSCAPRRIGNARAPQLWTTLAMDQLARTRSRWRLQVRRAHPLKIAAPPHERCAGALVGPRPLGPALTAWGSSRRLSRRPTAARVAPLKPPSGGGASVKADIWLDCRCARDTGGVSGGRQGGAPSSPCGPWRAEDLSTFDRPAPSERSISQIHCNNPVPPTDDTSPLDLPGPLPLSRTAATARPPRPRLLPSHPADCTRRCPLQ